MDKNLFFRNLDVPDHPVDVVLDTDAYNEVDDQFALAYLLNSKETLHLKAVYAAPFYNAKSSSPSDGMYKSYDEIMKILALTGNKEYEPFVYKGAEHYMKDEKTPAESDVVRDLISRAGQYSPKNPLYVIAIGAITNIASAIAAQPEIAENIVIVWLGGHDIHNQHGCREFNMMQDIAAARVVFDCASPLIQLPCRGVVSSFSISESELNVWLSGRNAVCNFLVENVMQAQKRAAGKPWSRIIWDVTAVAWLLNENDCFMESVIMPCHKPEYDMCYAIHPEAKMIRYVNYIKRDALFEDLIQKLTQY